MPPSVSATASERTLAALRAWGERSRTQSFVIIHDVLTEYLPKSPRKRLAKHPKFYFFDTGVVRALARQLTLELSRRTPEYGRLFEHFLIKELIHLSRYRDNDYRFSFYRTSAGAEVDLIVECPDGNVFAIEIKSSDNPRGADLRGLVSFKEVCPKARLLCAAPVARKRLEGEFTIYPWQEVFEVLNLGRDIQ